MHPVKRIEIIASSMELKQITASLDRTGVTGYAVIRDVTGKSDRGMVSDDFDIAGTTLSNVYVLAFCPPEQVQAVVADIKPILDHYGGVCYVSDAMEFRSMNCMKSL
jgi:nitrogen regulatory protein PII